jgi:hypothetical protein
MLGQQPARPGPRPGARRALRGFDAYLASASELLLAAGRRIRVRRGRRSPVAVAHALRFETWRSLVRRGGAEPTVAVELMVAMVTAASRAAAASR